MVTIILPIYNGERYLSVALESVKAQTFSDFECLCIDDGSSDSSPEIVRKYCVEDTRFRLIQQPNVGVAAARNRGIKESKGQYITFIDQDDALLPELLEKLLLIANNTHCDVVEAQYVEFYTAELPNLELQSKYSIEVSNTPFDDFWGVGNNTCTDVNAWGKLYTKSVIEDILFPEGVFGADDYVFTARLYSKISRYAKTDLRVYLYRMHPHNVTMQMPMRYIMGVLQSREIVWNELLKDNNLLRGSRASVCRRYCKDILSWTIKKYCRNKYKEQEVQSLRAEVERLIKIGVINSLSLKDMIKCYLFCRGYDRILKILFPRMFRLKDVIRHDNSHS